MNSLMKARDLKKTRFSRAAPRPESDEILGNLGASDFRRGLSAEIEVVGIASSAWKCVRVIGDLRKCA